METKNKKEKLSASAEEKLYNFSDLKQVFYMAAQCGAVIRDAVDNNMQRMEITNIEDVRTPHTITQNILDTIQENTTTPDALKDILSNRMLLLGVCAEVMKLDSIE